jgi:hypothetical protein
MKSQFYGPKKSESGRGLITDSVPYFLRSSMPTQTHDFSNHNKCLWPFKDSTHAELADCWKTASSTVGNPERFQNLMRIMIFSIAILLSQLGSLMICIHDLTVLAKRKETIRYHKSFGYGGKCTINKHFYCSNGVSVPTEEGSIIPIMSISHHPHIMGFSNHPPSGLFTNKFLHVSINNKIISVNRKEAYSS